MARFVYVFDEKGKDELIKRGYTLMQADEAAQKYVFSIEGNEYFTLDNVEGVESNILTF